MDRALPCPLPAPGPQLPPYLKQQPPPLDGRRTPGLTALGPRGARRSPRGLRAARGQRLERLAAHQAHGAAHPARHPAGPGRGRGLPASRPAPSPSDLSAPGVCVVGKKGDAPGPPRRSPPPPPPPLRQAVGVRGPGEGRRHGLWRQTVGRGPEGAGTREGRRRDPRDRLSWEREKESDAATRERLTPEEGSEGTETVARRTRGRGGRSGPARRRRAGHGAENSRFGDRSVHCLQVVSSSSLEK